MLWNRMQLEGVTGDPLATLQRMRPAGWVLDANGVAGAAETLAWGAALAPSGLVQTHQVTATTGAATAIALPSVMVPGVRHVFIISNASGGALGTFTWAAGYLMPTFVPPADTKTAVLEFVVLSATQLRLLSGSNSGVAVVQGVVTPAWVPAGVTIAPLLGNVFDVIAATAVPFTILSPETDIVGASIRIRIENASSGVAGGVTWGAAYQLLNGALGELPDGWVGVLTFTCLGAGAWVETARTVTDGVAQLFTWSSLTNAQVLALPTAGIAVVPAPGAGFVNLPTRAAVRTTIGVNVGNINAAAELLLGGELFAPFLEASGNLTALLATAGGRIGIAQPASLTDALAGLENQPLSIAADNAAAGDFTNGDAANVYRVGFLYSIVAL